LGGDERLGDPKELIQSTNASGIARGSCLEVSGNYYERAAVVNAKVPRKRIRTLFEVNGEVCSEKL
jgi:hypothetical protein